MLKSKRWLLLRNRLNLSTPQAVQQDEVLHTNQPLMTVYILRDEPKRLWIYHRPGWAQKAWKQRCTQARQSRIPAELIAQRLNAYWHGIVARCRHPLNTSVVEGINKPIKVIKRHALRLRDEEYFFLKIRAGGPGIPR